MQGQLLLYFFYSQTCLRVGGDFINTLGIFQIYSLSPFKKKKTKKQNLSFTISKAEVERRLKIETNMHIFRIFVMTTVSEIKPTDIKLGFRHFTVFQCSVPIGNTQLTKLP